MTTDLSKYDASQLPSADVLERQRYAIVVADWNSEITYAMAQGALDTVTAFLDSRIGQADHNGSNTLRRHRLTIDGSGVDALQGGRNSSNDHGLE